MKKALYIYFLFSVFVGTSIYFAQKLNIILPKVVQFYLNDFLIIPIVLITCLFILRRSKSDGNYQIPIWVVLYICSIYALLYEYFLPKYNSRYTADIIDVFLYFISGLIFFFLQKSTKIYET